MFEPCRARTVRMSTLRSGRRRRTSPGRSATSRALKEMRKRGDIRWVSLFLYVRVWSGLNGSKSWLRSVHRRRHHVRLKIIYFFRKKQATSDFCAIMLYYKKVRCIKRGE